jgi:hypothetical protein
VNLTPIPEVSCIRLGAEIKPSQVDIFQVTLAEQQYDMLGAKVKPDYILPADPDQNTAISAQ